MGRYQDLRTIYDVDKTIGTGGFAKVKLATHILTGEKVAIKIMEKASLGDDYPRVKQELEALKSISHHNICKLYQVIETATHFFMVMEYCSGGELFDHIVDKSKLSEAESRTFFRQILSAVAYLHSMGYAHRDLKPENILLDNNMNLKLIDFGLCAKPTGGIKSYLKTSCGSPTYAAPELIKGKIYLGSEIDVWSMGVLLYALLCGFLPFDCDSIESLYKKILSGSYEEPPWLSEGSREIIKSMLQVDPQKRITVDELLSHHWVTNVFFLPVSSKTLRQHREKNNCVISAMAKHYGINNIEMWERINLWSYNYDTATYLLLLQRSRSGLPLKLTDKQFTNRTRLRSQQASYQIKDGDKLENALSPRSRQTYALLKQQQKMDFNEKENIVHKTPVRTVRKRVHSNEESPVPNKITPGKSRGTPTSKAVNSPSTPTTPSNKLLYSIEKKLHQVRNILTPRKRTVSSTRISPITLRTKNLCNVSTTSYTNPDFLLTELKKVLSDKGIICKCKGYRVRGKVEEKRYGCIKSCSFELEVCNIDGASDTPLVGIRRKRLKGDSWCYKQICEWILNITQTSDVKT